jgi:hypothetical protein
VVVAKNHQHEKLEQVCRYIRWLSVSDNRLSQTVQGGYVDLLKAPNRSGAAHVIFESLDFIVRHLSDPFQYELAVQASNRKGQKLAVLGTTMHPQNTDTGIC